jgi:hypothetical protein
MPEVLADPDSKIRKTAGDGKTTYQVPVGPETIFFNSEGAKFSEIIDGTSQTIMIVEVAPANAVEWTKPADWQVDLAHPRQGVERSGRNRFTGAWADGSVQLVPTDIEEAKLRALLTPAGREVVDRP